MLRIRSSSSKYCWAEHNRIFNAQTLELIVIHNHNFVYVSSCIHKIGDVVAGTSVKWFDPGDCDSSVLSCILLSWCAHACRARKNYHVTFMKYTSRAPARTHNAFS